jgi:hypothetical protein
LRVVLPLGSGSRKCVDSNITCKSILNNNSKKDCNRSLVHDERHLLSIISLAKSDSFLYALMYALTSKTILSFIIAVTMEEK